MSIWGVLGRRLAVAAGAGAVLLTTAVHPAGADTVHTYPDDDTWAAPVSLRASAVNTTDKVFVDGYGREVVLRGYAVSGSTKLKESGMLPFRSTADATESFKAMKNMAGSNVVRFQILWEGTEPTRGTINTEYLDKAVAQIKEATSLGLRVIVEFHQDLMARALFPEGSDTTGEGMPDWVVDGLGLRGKAKCNTGSLICPGKWAQYQQTDEAGVRPAARAFWSNQLVTAKDGTKFRVQDAFVKHAAKVLAYLQSRLQLSAGSWNRIVGFEPANEPFDGEDMKGVGKAQQWDEEKLWPFYRKIRTAMNDNGWKNKLLFAEPNVFWNSEQSIFAPALGTHPDPKKTGKIVFTPHYYNTARQNFLLTSLLGSAVTGEYLAAFDSIRAAARDWGSPAFVSEFGAFVEKDGKLDTARILAGMYQGMNSGQTVSGDTLDDYQPVLSGTQWHWDIYHDRHKDDNPGGVENDGWNGEDHSVIERDDNGKITPVIDSNLIGQAYPQAVQGSLLNFQYNARPSDATSTALNWLKLCPGDGLKCYFDTNRFIFQAWKGRNSNAPTQTFLPSQFNPANTTIITDTGIYKATDLSATPATTGKSNEVLLRPEPHTTNAGRQLSYWTDPTSTGTDAETRHFLFVLPNTVNTLTALGHDTEAKRQTFLKEIQDKLKTSVNNKTNPVRLARTDARFLKIRLKSAVDRCVTFVDGSWYDGNNIIVDNYSCGTTDYNTAEKWLFADNGQLQAGDGDATYCATAVPDEEPSITAGLYLRRCDGSGNESPRESSQWRRYSDDTIHIYTISGKDSGRCLTAPAENEGRAFVQGCTPGEARQQWEFFPYSG
ncbi:cellulase family glycosylhydrolase [Streptomyces sp. NPDC005533]|uniref:cellulase family glycosylhydrolase n=1 Tax=Streptomyces sp. NPDC005533 TaxID=3364723 RepID=UPI00368EB3DB